MRVLKMIKSMFVRTPRTSAPAEYAATDGYGSNYRPWERRPMATVTLDKI